MIVRVLAVLAGLICVAVAAYLSPVLALVFVGVPLVIFGLTSDYDKGRP